MNRMLIGLGLLTVLGVAERADAQTNCFIEPGGVAWIGGSQMVTPSGRVYTTNHYAWRPEDRSDCDRRQAEAEAQAPAHAAAAAPRVPLPGDAIAAACAKWYPDGVRQGRCLIELAR